MAQGVFILLMCFYVCVCVCVCVCQPFVKRVTCVPVTFVMEVVICILVTVSVKRMYL